MPSARIVAIPSRPLVGFQVPTRSDANRRGTTEKGGGEMAQAQQLTVAGRCYSLSRTPGCEVDDEAILREVMVEDAYCLDFLCARGGPLSSALTAARGAPLVVDVGAHIGGFSLALLARLPDAGILAFEPNPDTHQTLLQNLRANGAAGVRPFPYALGGATGVGRLRMPAGCPKDSQIEPWPEEGSVSPARPGGEAIQIHRLPEVLCRESITKVDLLKLDCEGAELEILASMGTALGGVRLIVGEYHGIGRAEELARLLRSGPAPFRCGHRGYRPHVGLFFAINLGEGDARVEAFRHGMVASLLHQEALRWLGNYRKLATSAPVRWLLAARRWWRGVPPPRPREWFDTPFAELDHALFDD